MASACSLEGCGRDAATPRKNKNAAPLGRPLMTAIIRRLAVLVNSRVTKQKNCAAPAPPPILREVALKC
jgi:hypothetical protein